MHLFVCLTFEVTGAVSSKLHSGADTYSAVDAVMVWFTVGVSIGSNPHGHHVPADIPLPLSTVDLYPPPAGGPNAVARLIHRHWHSECKDGADAVASGCIAAAVPDLRSTNRSTGTGDLSFDLITSQAESAPGWVLLGELDKYTTVSARRFTSIRPAASGLELDLAGAAGEKVTITALREESGLEKTGGGQEDGGKGYKVVVKLVTIGADGTAKLTIK